MVNDVLSAVPLYILIYYLCIKYLSKSRKEKIPLDVDSFGKVHQITKKKLL
jgi:hypothetical protein